MTQVLDRYLAAIARHLPKAEATDIISELRENLLSEIEEKEAALGRKLNTAELDALLTGFGHPLAVAARYRKARYLIGPEIYPFWMATLRVVFGILVAVAVVGLIVAAASGELQSRQVAQGLAQVIPNFLSTFAILTLVFAVMERSWNGRMKLKWNPRQLPAPRSSSRKPVAIISEMVAGALGLLWWTGFVRFSALVPIPPFVHIHLAHVWAGLYWIVVAYWSAELAISALELARPRGLRLNAALRAAKWVAGCAILAHLLRAGHWIDVNASVPPYALASMRHGFDKGMQLGILASLVVMAWQAAWDARRAVWPASGDGRRAETPAAA
jgi:hypothetical protein